MHSGPSRCALGRVGFNGEESWASAFGPGWVVRLLDDIVRPDGGACSFSVSDDVVTQSAPKYVFVSCVVVAVVCVWVA